MALSIRERVLLAATAVVTAALGSTVQGVELERDTDVTDFDYVVIRPGTSTPEPYGTDQLLHRMPVAIELYAQGAPAVARTRIDAMRVATLTALAADPTLGGLAADIQEADIETEVDMTPYASPVMGDLLGVVVDYFTSDTDPTVHG